MSHSSENSLFRLFVAGWMSLGGVVLFLYVSLMILGLGHDAIGNIMCFLPLLLLSLLIYSYVNGKDALLKKLSYTYMIVGIPCLLLMFIAPMMMWG